MLILILVKSELNQAHRFQYTCWENFQVHLQLITYHYERTNHDTHLDFFISKPFRILFAWL